jgi:hypothetical protein
MCAVSNHIREQFKKIVGKKKSMNEWVLIGTWKKTVWSTRIGRISPIWNPLPNCRVSMEGRSGLMRCGTICHIIESTQRCRAPGPSVLGSPDPRRTETFARCTRQVSTSRLPEPTPLTVYRDVSQVPPPLCT